MARTRAVFGANLVRTFGAFESLVADAFALNAFSMFRTIVQLNGTGGEFAVDPLPSKQAIAHTVHANSVHSARGIASVSRTICALPANVATTLVIHASSVTRAFVRAVVRVAYCALPAGEALALRLISVHDASSMTRAVVFTFARFALLAGPGRVTRA